MANLDRIVNVEISLDTTGVSTEGFSTLLCVGPHVHGLARVLTYTAASQMIDDGFSADDPLYQMVSDAFAQTPSPAAVKVGRRKVGGVTVDVGQLSVSGTYTLTVSWAGTAGTVQKRAYSYTNDSGSESDIMNGLLQQISKDPASVITVTNAPAAAGTARVGQDAVGEEADLMNLHITAKDGETDFAVETTANLDVVLDDPQESIAETMAAVMGSDSDFYGVALTSKKEADILAMAEWTESAGKLYGTSFGGDAVKNSEMTNDIGSQLKAKNYYRTFWFYHDAADEYPEAAVMARCFAIDPGGETWALKKLAGITVDPLTETEYNAVTGKNGNTFELFRNVSITQNGKVAAGEWIDVIRFRDWLEEEIKVNVFNLLINRDKVPYTDAGIAAIEARIRQALELGQTRGGIAPTEYDEDGNENPGYVLTVPLASSISANQKASRVLTDVRFTARLAGAIHVVEITGSLTYENLAA